MKVLVILALALCCSGQVVVPYQYSPVPYSVGVKYQGTDAFGQTTFGHQTFDQARHEVRLADGRVVGQWSYIDANGEPAITYFEAGPNGYRVLGSNILPEAPEAENNLLAPEPVTYTAEVAEARAEFMKVFQEAAAAAAAAPAEPEVDASAAALAVPAESPADAAVAAEPAAEEAAEPARKRREATKIPLPYLHAIPTETETTIETKQFEPVKAATPADTAKLELTTKEHVFKVPGFKYVRPVVEVKPVKYTALAPQVLPYQAAHPFYPFGLSGYQYPSLLTPVVKEEKQE